MTSASLKDLRELLQMTFKERNEITHDITAARRESDQAKDRYERWERGFFFKRIRKEEFAKRKVAADEAAAKLRELEEQLRLTTITTQMDIDAEQAEPYYRMRDAFASLGDCQMIWDTISERSLDRIAERTIAERGVNRVP